MQYEIHYACTSDIGLCRDKNQDNFLCAGIIRDDELPPSALPLTGTVSAADDTLFAVFDGMGGEERGEVASLLASQEAVRFVTIEDPVADMMKLCENANLAICDYITQSGISSAGTTAAIMAFTRRRICLCNVGDSKIFRFSHRRLEQISVDHIMPAAYGKKPPLSQNLGIPPEEMRIEPYVALGRYHPYDVYLICSDGLTDMVTVPEIESILQNGPIEADLHTLVDKALQAGGKDNITAILCQIIPDKRGLFGGLFRKREGSES